MKSCPVLYPIEKKRIIWDVYISIILAIVSIVTPWNIAFVDDEILDHLVFDLIVDISFLSDLILNFNTAKSIFKDFSLGTLCMIIIPF